MRIREGLVSLGLVLTTVPSAGDAGEAEVADDPVVARWDVGELRRSTFLDRYRPKPEVLQTGGRRLRDAICKAAYREVFGARALARELDRSEEYLAAVERWQTRALAAAYVERHGPDPDAIPMARLEALYTAEAESRFTTPGTFDLAVLFVRCEADDPRKTACRGRLENRLTELARGTDFAAVIDRERGSSGEANGVFHQLSARLLARELRATAFGLAEGQRSPVIETAMGFFVVELLARRDPQRLPFDRVHRQVRRLAVEQATRRWRAAEVARLRADRDPSLEPVSDEAVLAETARREELHRDPDFVYKDEISKRWKLADLGFFSDSRVLPTLAELGEALHQDPARRARYLEMRSWVASPPVGDRFERLQALRRLQQQLDETDAVPDFLRQLAEDPEAALHMTDLGWIDRSVLGRLSSALADGVPANPPDGWYAGPILLAESQVFDSVPAVPAGPALFVIEATRLPPIAQIRDSLLRDFRRRASANCEIFQQLVGHHIGLEVFPAAAASSAGDAPKERSPRR